MTAADPSKITPIAERFQAMKDAKDREEIGRIKAETELIDSKALLSTSRLAFDRLVIDIRNLRTFYEEDSIKARSRVYRAKQIANMLDKLLTDHT